MHLWVVITLAVIGIVAAFAVTRNQQTAAKATVPATAAGGEPFCDGACPMPPPQAPVMAPVAM